MLIRKSLFLAAIAAVALTGSLGVQAGGMHRDHRDLRHDRTDLRRDHRDIHRDRQQRRHALRAAQFAANHGHPRLASGLHHRAHRVTRDIRHDRHDMRRDHRDIRHDVRHLHNHRHGG